MTLARVSTGNAQLDTVLGGGFPSNSINVIMGEPGSGKTILAERMVFANAGDDRPILYLTTLSEPLEKVVRYLQQFNFFSEERLASSVIYDSIAEPLIREGVRVLLPRLRAAIEEQQPKMIVIDSFKAIHDLGAPISELRKMLFEVAGLLSAYETTAFFLGEYSGREPQQFPEFSIADGIIELLRDKASTRDERHLRVLKLRGSSYREGLHAFRINSEGLEVFPRLISPSVPLEYRLKPERATTGIAGLDRMLDGGLPQGRTTFVVGPTGSGKTTLCLQFAIAGVHRDETCLYVNFEENPSQLMQQIHSLGENPEEISRRGLLFLYRSPVELQIDSIITEIFEAVSQRGVRRVIIDGVGDLLMASSDPQRLHDYLYALAQHFAARDVVALFTYETLAITDREVKLSALADNILSLDVETDGKARRTLRVVKARGVAHDLNRREVTINEAGVQVG